MLRNLLLLCLTWSLLAPPASGAGSAVTLSADIGPRPVAEALAAFGRQTGLQLIYLSTIAETQQAKGARAGLTASEALTQLLDGTGLGFEFINARTVRIFPAPTLVPTAVVSSPRSSERRTGSGGFALEEVVVTATRREEQASRVPIDMAVWTQDAMEASGIKGIAQIGALTPGVDFSFRPGTGGDLYTDLNIRGVGNRHGTTVGIYLDDMQIPPARSVTYLRSFPPTFDLDRVEVLRGPQGALLGDHTQGGAIRFIMNQPSLTAFTGLARAEWATTARGAMSYEAGAAVGGPVINNVLGFRISGWYRTEGGYVDRVDPFTNTTVDANANANTSKIVRAALAFAPSKSVRVTPSLTYQSIRLRDSSAFYPNLSNPSRGELKNGSLLRQPFEDAFYLVSLKLSANLHIADFSAVTSYFDRIATATFDYSYPPVDYADTTVWYASAKQRVFSQEAQLTSADPDAWRTWTAGAYFANEHSRHPATLINRGIVDIADATVIDQSTLAGFGQLALKLTKRLTASAGLRIGRSQYQFFTEVPPVFHAHATDSWATPRFVVSFQADEHNLYYLTAAKGHGSGGVYPGDFGNPQLYPPDTLWSYEIGGKHVLLDGRVHLDASVFHIRWNNGQALSSGSTPGGEVSAVPGTVVSDGFDLAVQAFVTEHTKMALGIAYNNAHITETVTRGGIPWVRKGERLTGSPWNLTASIEREAPLRSGATASVRVEDIYHSHNPGPLFGEDPASPFHNWAPPVLSTNVLNLRAGVKWSRLDVVAFVTNALDAQPTLQRQDTPTPSAVTLTPRSLGLSATWRY